MPGILDNSMDPKTQGILQAAFALMQASGPSRLPVSIGSAIGQAGTAGMQASDAAAKLQADLKLKKLQADKIEQDAALSKAITSEGGMGSILSLDPDRMEAVGLKLALGGHAGGAGVIAAAQKKREKQDAAAELKTLQGATLPDAASDIVGVSTSDDDAMRRVEEATKAGKTASVKVAPEGEGIFSSLINSQVPAVARQARTQQGLLNSQTTGSVTPQKWLELQKTLASQESAQLEKDRNLPKSTLIVQDPSSQTGWSHLDTRTGEKFKGAPPPASANNQPPGGVVPKEHQDLHGADYLATLAPGMQSVVKSIAEGRTSLNDASMRYGNRDAMKERVLQYRQDWHGNIYKNRQEFEAPNGKTQLNITAMNTVIAHMGTLDRLFDAMKNNDLRGQNAIVNEIKKQLGKDTVTNPELAAQAVGEELMRVFRQVGASEREAKAWEGKFNADKGSLTQQKGALRTAAELVGGRLDALNDMWKRTVDANSDYPILSPQSKAAFSKLGIVKQGVPLTPDATATPAAAPQPKRRAYNPATGKFE